MACDRFARPARPHPPTLRAPSALDVPRARPISGRAPIRPTSSPSAAPTISTRARGTENATAMTRSRAGPSQRSPWFRVMLPPTTIRWGLKTSTRLTHESANARLARSMILAAVRIATVFRFGHIAGVEAASPRRCQHSQALRRAAADGVGRCPRNRHARRDGLEVAATAAATWRPVDVDQDVPELAGDAVRPADQPTAGNDRAADPGRDRQVQEVGQAPGRPERPLGQRCDVRVPLERRPGKPSAAPIGPARAAPRNDRGMFGGSTRFPRPDPAAPVPRSLRRRSRRARPPARRRAPGAASRLRSQPRPAVRLRPACVPRPARRPVPSRRRRPPGRGSRRGPAPGRRRPLVPARCRSSA